MIAARVIRIMCAMTTSTIARSTRWAVVQKPDPETWGAVVKQVGRYLEDSAAAGYLAGDADQRAFYVKCDKDTNANRRGLSFVVGLALTRPGDYASFRFDHDDVDCRVTEINSHQFR